MAHLGYPENCDFLMPCLFVRDAARGENGRSMHGTHLLLEITSVLFVDEDEIKIITRAELLVYVAERWCQVEPAEEEPNWDCFP
jgi:hypothetical protein